MNADQWSRAKDVFCGAIERPPEDRAAFLIEACGGDAAPRAEAAIPGFLEERGSGPSRGRRSQADGQ
jgi:hypothetical protein